MGQRTQLLVIEKKPNGETEKRVYHNQWGQGKRMYNGIMSILQSLSDGVSWDGKYDPLLKDVELKNIPSFKEYYQNVCYQNPISEENKALLDQANVEEISTIKKLFDTFSNNDGGAVIEIEWLQDQKCAYDPEYKVRVGFLLNYDNKDPNEVENNFKQYVSPERFREIEGYCGTTPYFDDNFLNSFIDMCKYMEVKWLH